MEASGAVLEDDPQRLALPHEAHEPEDVGVVHLSGGLLIEGGGPRRGSPDKALFEF